MGFTRLDAINYLNIVCLLASLVLAVYLPFELFIFAYVILGPLHYLTEISWLYDRRFFTGSKTGWWYLLLPVVPVTVAHFTRYPYSHEVITVLVAATLVLAGSMAISNRGSVHWAGGIIGCMVGWLLLSFDEYAVLLTALLPTLIHVYVFTGIFMVYGAIRTPSFSGFCALGVFLLGPVVALHLTTTPSPYEVSDQLLDATLPFLSLQPLVQRALGLAGDRDGLIAFMRLLAFAYTYHYLNWFSKSEVIRWHKMPRGRAVGIVIAYVGAVGLYFYDFRAGFGALLALSIGHVVLELPLNVQAVVGVFRGGKVPE